MTRILATFALIAGAVLMIAPAEAGFTLCNKSKAGANVALGYANGASGWMAEGWWSIASGDCQTLVKSPLAGSYAYLLVDGGRLPPGAKQSGGWFCTDDNGFSTHNADYSNDQHELTCEDAGLKSEQFREIKIGGGNVTYNLRR